MDDPDGGRRHPIVRAIWIGSVPVAVLAGFVALSVYPVGYPTNVGLGVLLFVVVWFWFRALGRLAF